MRARMPLTPVVDAPAHPDVYKVPLVGHDTSNLETRSATASAKSNTLRKRSHSISAHSDVVVNQNPN